MGYKSPQHGERLKAWLDAHGPATNREIMEGLGWGKFQFDTIIKQTLVLEWLVSPGVRTVNRNGRMVLYASRGEHVLGVCEVCGRKNFHPAYRKKGRCIACARGTALPLFVEAIDTQGVDPLKPARCEPGSYEKVRILAARQEAGVDLFSHEDSCIEE